jgi:hypothetical protein
VLGLHAGFSFGSLLWSPSEHRAVGSMGIVGLIRRRVEANLGTGNVVEPTTGPRDILGLKGTSQIGLGDRSEILQQGFHWVYNLGKDLTARTGCLG